MRAGDTGSCSTTQYFSFESGNNCFGMLGSPSGSTDISGHSNAPDVNVDVYRDGVKIRSNVALKIIWNSVDTGNCNGGTGRLASGSADGNWKDGDILVLYTA